MSVIPASATPVPAVTATGLYLRSVALDCAHKVVRRRRRTRAQVEADYERGEWSDTLHARYWERVGSLEDYVYTADRRRIAARVEGELRYLPQSDYYRYRTERINALLAEFDLGAQGLVEVGCGAGRNLFCAATAGRWKTLRGLDISPTGIETVRRVVEHFQLDGVSAGPIDLLSPGSPGFADLRGAVAFTHYCLEQLPAHTETVLRNLLGAGVRRVIHIEPTPELYNPMSLSDLASISYIWRQNYLADLVATARRLEGSGLIRVVDVRRLGFAPTLRNAPTLVVWEPASA